MQKENVIKIKVITNIQKLSNIIYSKNSIQFRNDNIVNLINLKSLDKNTEILIQNKNMKPKLSFTENNIEIVDIDNKKLFMLNIDTSVSCKLIKGSLKRLFKQLKELLVSKNICIYRISKDIEILNISWLEIEEVEPSTILYKINFFFLLLLSIT